jgi:hypothetical protein
MHVKNESPYIWRKGYKYYKVHLQLNLFSSTSIICSWGSVCNNLGNCKIIICETEKEVDATLKRIIKVRKSRGYNISSILS